MTYFVNIAAELRLLIESPAGAGLREAQVAAAHSILAHFWSKSRPAICVMPTGSGKTAVMMLASILLRANRVLVVAPSRLLREQLAEKFAALDPLIPLGALHEEVTRPQTSEVKKRITSAEEWNALTQLDVVVTTPYAASPGIKNVPRPDPELFDLLIFDEAHHTPAPIYRALRESFPQAKALLFTATPFRRDDREIGGDLVFTYDLRRAIRDGVFGRLRFSAVDDTPKIEDRDLAIARAALARFKQDKSHGMAHRVVVRASSKERADALMKIYKDNTDLNLRVIHSRMSAKYVRTAVEGLRNGDLDGVIVVDMLGEGFDLPNLKIAALHSPHKSLAVTLQFIGRFARTSSNDNIGEATFFAIPAEIDGPAGKLYTPGAEWNELVGSLSGVQLEAETRVRDFIRTFAVFDGVDGHNPSPPDSLDDETAWRLLRSVRPYFHVKIYEVTGPVLLDAKLSVPRGLEPVLVRRSVEHHAVIWVGREVSPVRWSKHQDWSNVRYELFVIVHDPEHSLLFVCTSRRENAVYDDLVESVIVAKEEYRRLATDAVTRVLRGVEGAEFFSVGMRNRAGWGGGGEESYRMLSGRSAGRAIRAQDAASYSQGHAFCRGTEQGHATTVGYSSGSKVWSNRRADIYELFDWMRSLAGKLRSTALVRTGSGLDFLKVGRRVREVKCRVIAADLPPEAYQRDGVTVRAGAGHAWLVDVALKPLDQGQSTSVVQFSASVGEVVCKLEMDISQGRPAIRPLNNAARHAKVFEDQSGNGTSLAAYLQDHNPVFLLEDLSLLHGDELEDPAERDVASPISAQIKGIDWDAEGVDVFAEKTSQSGKRSLFAFVEDRLRQDADAVVFTDDAANEIADYVSIKDGGPNVVVQLFHCKAARDPRGRKKKVPYDDIGQLYEVIGQAVKCRRWLSPRRLFEQIVHRHDKTKSFRLCQGTLSAVESLLANPVRVIFQVTVVQPALSTEPKETIASLLSAADASMRGGHQAPIELWGTEPSKRISKQRPKQKSANDDEDRSSDAAPQLRLFTAVKS